jgi:endonuclease/exonuclease/phosphatase family metal-dependent hydrolase
MPDVTVATFNTHHGVDRRFRPYDVVAACARLDTDVIALQETWRPRGEPGMAAEVADQLGYKVHEVVVSGADRGHILHVRRDVEQGAASWGLAVLSRLPITPRPVIELGRVPGDPALRKAQPVDIDVDGAVLTLVNMHLTHRLYASVRHLVAAHRLAPPPDRPAVLVGDMNMWGPVITSSVPGYRRAVRGRTWPSHRPHSQIDHILVSQPVAVVHGEVMPFAGSDHRPVRATLRF